MTLKEQLFYAATKNRYPMVLVVVVLMPNGCVETIVNNHGIPDKLQYYREKYDDDFKLKANPQIEIIGVVLV